MYRAKDQRQGALRAVRRRACARTRCGTAGARERAAPRRSSATSSRCTTSRWSTSPTGAIVGFEALVRWQHPDRGLLGRRRVHPAGRGDRPDRRDRRWVLRQACRQARRAGAARDGEPAACRVNLSARQLADPDLVELGRARCCGRPALDPATLLPGDHRERRHARRGADGSDRCDELKEPRRAAGHRRLRHRLLVAGLPAALPVDVLKIDRSFVDGARATTPQDASIAAAIISLAHALGPARRSPRASRPTSSSTLLRRARLRRRPGLPVRATAAGARGDRADRPSARAAGAVATPKNSASSSSVASGRSMKNRCPVPATIRNCASGIDSASSSLLWPGMTWSSSPVITSVGAAIVPSRSALSWLSTAAICAS